MKIVSLLPSATEIVCALGLGDQLVGVSHECDFPAGVRRLPKVTRTVIDKQLGSDSIDRQVRHHLQEQAALYSLDTSLLDVLQPDLIVSQALCDVCAVSAAEVEDVAAHLSSRPLVVNLEPVCLDDLFQIIDQLARITGRVSNGRRLCRHLRQRLLAVEARIRCAGSYRPRVAFLEWLMPPFNGGHWTPELIGLAGGIDVFDGAGQASRAMTWDDVAAADPELMFVACCGYSAERAMQDLRKLRADGRLPDSLLRHRLQVLMADGNHYFNRPGPRLIDSLEILAHALHPELKLPTPDARAMPALLQ